MKSLFLSLLGIGLGTATLAGPTNPDKRAPEASSALDRPAVIGRQPARAFLLGIARAGKRIVAVGERGMVLLSNDEGLTWHQSPIPVSVTLTAVRFADKDHGFAVGHGGTVLSTSDGGRTWTRLLDGKRIADIELEAARLTEEPASMRAAERLQRDGPDKPLLDVFVKDAKHALVIGAYGVILATEDGGQTWASWRSRIDNPKEQHLYTLRVNADQILIAGEQGMALLSNDAGKRFQRLAVPYQGSYFTAELPGNQVIVLAGMRGNVWRSADSGATWARLESPVPASVTSSVLRSDGTMLLTNQAGMVMVLAGQSLSPLKVAALPPLNTILQTADGGAIVLTSAGIQKLKSTPMEQAK